MFTTYNYDQKIINSILKRIIVKDDLQVKKYENVYIFPQDYFEGKGIKNLNSKAIGVYDADFRIIPGSKLERFPPIDSILPNVVNVNTAVKFEKLNGSYLYGGLLSHHFGHILTESIARLWCLNQNIYDGIVFCGTRSDIPINAINIFNVMGIDINKVIIKSHPINIEVLTIAEPSMINGKYCSKKHISLFDQAFQKNKLKNFSSSKRPLYLSRRLLNNDKKELSNGKEFEDILLKMGFRVEHPQFLTLSEQIEIINSHNIIMGINGSAMHTVMFSNEKKILIGLGGNINLNFPLIDSAFNNNGNYINCLSKNVSNTFDLDINMAIESLDKILARI